MKLSKTDVSVYLVVTHFIYYKAEKKILWVPTFAKEENQRRLIYIIRVNLLERLLCPKILNIVR